ncbi:S-layer homology domain-containing protein [Planococcus glaciei]|uniref:S-layer homology domain-containing protein n=1 Tax=Planococcus glaciei TaxID=459472 RepID=UPI001C738731|nr:S-layer homology domain-containing protein [Planococcus glaciei]MBX0316845.1 S-layer homology domain-containing protein [Planococcus glaciei]
MKFNKIFFIPLLMFIVALSPITQSAQAASDDITGHWHETEIREMIAKRIMNGYGDGIYKPNAQVTRGQFSAILTRALNLEPTTEGIYFSDVTEASGVLNEVLTAANAGLITGYPNGTFKPNEPISRQHMAIMVKRAMDYLQMTEKEEPLMFADRASILPEYHPAISNTVAYGIFNGSTIKNQVYFRPFDYATRGDAAAVLSRLLKAASQEQPDEPNENPALTYHVANINKDGNPVVVKKYDSFESAEIALKSGVGQVVLYDNAIVRMSSGVVITIPTPTSSLTNVYTKPDLKNAFTYVASDTELEYLGSTADYVTVRVSGTTGYIKHSNASLRTWNMLDGRSYYSVTNGDLYHNIFLHQSSKFASYNLGKAPSFMIAGARYYSWNGIDFTTASGSIAGSGHNYFQFLPARSSTTYTAQQIDSYIIQMLKDLEAKYPNNSTYKDASKRSKLIGIGAHLKKVEKENKVNALMILALAQHESAYGLSTRALTYNNLFGLRVYDDNPANDHFRTVAENIDELISVFWNKNYIPPNAVYANGSVFGTKALGMNMRYASDPYWGAKAAGHWYRIDKALGGKDLNAYQLGMTTTPGLNVRTSMEIIGTNIAYSYKQAGLPLIIFGEQKLGSRNWYEVSSDHIDYPNVFVAGEYIRKLPVLK